MCTEEKLILYYYLHNISLWCLSEQLHNIILSYIVIAFMEKIKDFELSNILYRNENTKQLK